MPQYEITVPDGRKVTLDGDHEPTESDLRQIYAGLPPLAPKDGEGSVSQMTAPHPAEVSAEAWKGLYAGIDEVPYGVEQRAGMNFLDQRLGPDKETRAQAINQSYVGEQMPHVGQPYLNRNWPIIRDAYAKSMGYTQGEPITDWELYGKIGESLAEVPEKRKLAEQWAAATPSERAGMMIRNFFPYLKKDPMEWMAKQGEPFVAIPEAPANLPDIPQLGLSNPALVGGVYNSVVKPLVEGVESPLTAGTVGVGGLLGSVGKLVPAAQKAVGAISGLFAGVMAKSAVEQAPGVAKVLKDPNSTLQERVEAVGGVARDTVLAVTAGLHAAMELSPKPEATAKLVENKTPSEAAQALRQEANQTPLPEYRDALKEAATKLDDIPEVPKPAEEAPKAEPAKLATESKPMTDESHVVGVRNADVDRELKAMGLGEATRGEKLTFKEAAQWAEEESAKDPMAGSRLVEEITDKPRPITGNEDALLARELNRRWLLKKEAGEALQKAVGTEEAPALAEKFQALEQDYIKALEADAKVGTESSHSLSFRRIRMAEDYSLRGMEQKLIAANEGKPLTEVQREQIADLSKKLEEAQGKYEDYRSRMSDLLMSDEPARQGPPKSRSRVASLLSEYADAARQRIKERLMSGRVSSGLDPLDIADHAIIGADYIAKGVGKFADWSSAMVKEFGERIRPHLQAIYDKAKEIRADESKLQAYKTTKTRQTEELKAKVAAGDLSKKERRPLRLDEEGLRLKAEYEKAKTEFDTLRAKAQYANRTNLEKASDTIVRWRRGFLLSSPVTLAKLSAAAALRMVATPVEEAVGAGLGKIPGISKVMEGAPREGGFSKNAEVVAITDFVTKGMSDSAEMLKTGKGTLEQAFGRDAKEVRMSDIAPRSVIEFFGNIHGALKAPVKRAEFARSFAKRLEWADEHGVDIKDPLVQTRVAMEAYKDANRAIFMQDNKVVDAYKAMVRTFERPDKETGKPTVAGKLAAATLKTLFPIVKVPTNIVGETFTYVAGAPTGIARTIHAALTDGIEKLTPEQKDSIARQLKKGAVGSALLLYGYYNADQFGGYYQPGEKRKEGELSPGSMSINGQEIPKYLLHNPAMEQMQIGATVRKVAESKLHKRDQEEQGLASAAFTAGLGLVEEVPFARETVEMGKLFDPKERQYFEGELLKSMFVPAVIDWAARQMDRDAEGNQVRRKATTVGEHIQSGIPGLRRDLPAKGAPSVQTRD